MATPVSEDVLATKVTSLSRLTKYNEKVEAGTNAGAILCVKGLCQAGI